MGAVIDYKKGWFTMLEIHDIKDKAEAGTSGFIATWGLCCGHISILQVQNGASLIANVGGALIVLIQLYRMLKKKDV